MSLTNNAHQQQVNNGTAPPSRTREEDGKQTNELLEHKDGERLDYGAQSEAGRGNQAVEALGAVNRSDD